MSRDDRFAQLVIMFAFVMAVALPAHGYTNQEWKVIGIWNGSSWTPAGPSTTFSTKAEALAALHGLSAPIAPSLTIETPSGQSTAWFRYKYAAPDRPLNIPDWTYEAEAVAGTFGSEQAAYDAKLADMRHFCGPEFQWELYQDWTVVPGFQEPWGNLREYKMFFVSNTGNCDYQGNGTYEQISRFRAINCWEYPGYNLTGPAPWHCAATQVGYIDGRSIECSSESASPDVGNPCNVATGDKHEKEVDYEAGGLSFTRYYHSLTLETSDRFGPGWNHSYGSRIVRNSSGVVTGLSRPNGYQEAVTFRSNYYRGTVSGQTIEQSGSRWRLNLKNGGSEWYDSNGRLVELVSPGGANTVLAYDSAARLSTITGPSGHALQLNYNAQGLIESLIDPASGTISYSYNSAGGLNAVTYQDGTSRTYHYEQSGFPHHLTGISDESGTRFSTFAYDSVGRAISSARASGAGAVSLTYGANTTSVVDALGQSTSYTFTTATNDSRRITSVSRGGRTVSYTLPTSAADIQRRPTQTTDANGRITQLAYSYMAASRTEAFGTAAARTTTYQYRSFDELVTQKNEPGRRTSYTYDSNGSLLTRTVLDLATFEERTWTYTYSSIGQMLTADGPRTDISDVTTYTYYGCTTGYQCGQVQTITNALGHVTTVNSYNAHGQPLTITDPNGLVTTLTYDARQRLKSRTIGGEQTSFDYWTTGLLKKVTLPDGSFLEYTYDAAHRMTEIEDSEGNRVVYTLDGMGNRTAENLYDPTSALMRTRTRVFNTLNQLWKDVGAAGTAAVTTTFAYDNNDNQTGINAPLSHNTTQAYDELNRLKQVTDPLSGVTQYGYNALDQLISVTDPRSKVTSYTYNSLGDLKQQVSPDTGTTTNSYDSGGNLQTSTDARSKTATYAYDALNRVLSVTYPDQTISYTYDGGTNQKGRLTQVSDASGSTNWSYDSHGRVLSRQQGMGIIRTLSYAYDSAGRLETRTLPSGNTISYGYTDGKITSLTLNGSTTIISNVLYQPFGATRGWTWGNSTLAIREYDLDGKVTDIDSAGLKTYSYDDAFRITGIADASTSTLSQSYGYDLLDRVTSASGTSLNQGWTYDANGNRLTQTGSASSTYTISSTSNRLSSVSGALSRSYSYDNSGNVTGNGAVTFTYNDAGRMVSATKAGVTTTYALNALGQRVRKTVSGSSTYFVYDEAGRLVGEYDNSGSLIQETVWMDDIPVATLRPNGAGVSLFYIHTDHLNTPRKISRPSDNIVVWRWDSDPFGTTTAHEDPDGDSSSFSYMLRFPGQYLDAETSLHYNYFRDYDPQLGRYVQSDPIGLWGGVNTYGYVQGNPIRYADSLGLAIGDLPPPPPGYDPAAWERGVWDSGRPYVRNPTTGDRWTAHPEDASHWRHWDKEDGGRWPPNSKKPWSNQKRGLKKDQCASDPSGDAPPWEPPPDLMVPWLAPEYLLRMPTEPIVSPRFRIPFRIPFVVP